MKILYVTTVGITMGFFKSYVRLLLDEGHTVDIATSEIDYKVPDCYREWGCTVHPIPTSRSILSPGNLVAIKQIKRIVEENRYDIVHCHTPIAAMCTRLACRKARKHGTRVFYTAHGFHFFKGAPLKNWLFFYPVEKFCARYTDVLVTINQEDYNRAKRKFRAKQVAYIPGVGINVGKFANAQVDRAEKRAEIGVPTDATLLLSVGELNENKNHEVVLRAMASLDAAELHYAIAGRGERMDYLNRLAADLGVAERLHTLGFRTDIAELYKAADVCVLPSRREGLAVAALEGMAAGLPLIVSDHRGVRDYATDGTNALICPIDDVDATAEAIERLLADPTLRASMGAENSRIILNYDEKVINRMMLDAYMAQ